MKFTLLTAATLFSIGVLTFFTNAENEDTQLFEGENVFGVPGKVTGTTAIRQTTPEMYEISVKDFE